MLKLASLARIDMSDKEAESLSGEFETILNYVSEVKAVSTTKNSEPKSSNTATKNIWREDVEPHEPGLYTEKILNEAPEREGDYIRVKKIL